MKRAYKIAELINSVSPEPLKRDEIEEFYCPETMECRTGDKYESPILDIRDECKIPQTNNAFLLMGHKGCGKSTELNKMSKDLICENHRVVSIPCGRDLDLLGLVYSDLLIVMGEELIKIADDLKCKLKKNLADRINSFWQEGYQITTSEKNSNLSIEAGAGAETPPVFKNVLNLLFNVKAVLKFNHSTREEYRKKVQTRSSEWLLLINQIADVITEKLCGKQPIVIFEDLDKLDPESAWKIFYNYAATLTGTTFPIIFTFPIGLSYDPRFAALEAYFKPKTLPMIKIEKIDGSENPEGIKIIKNIIEKRADLSLFAENVIEELIKLTGGSLRDLFNAINVAATRALRRKSDIIEHEDIKIAFKELQTTLSRRIERNDFEFLITICNGNKEIIEDKQKLLEMMQASIVLEYNAKRWHNVHPLIKKFLTEQGLLGEENE